MSNMDTNVDVESDKRAKARHWLVNAQGQEVDTEEEATGIGYAVLGHDENFVQQSGGAAGDPITMWANFGMKTRATNVASQIRQKKGDAALKEQMDAVKSVFAMVQNEKQWLAEREPTTREVDKSKLFDAMLTQFTEDGISLTDAQKANLRQNIEEKADKRRDYMKHAGVQAKYAALVGKPTVTTESLVAGL